MECKWGCSSDWNLLWSRPVLCCLHVYPHRINCNVPYSHSLYWSLRSRTKVERDWQRPYVERFLTPHPGLLISMQLVEPSLSSISNCPIDSSFIFRSPSANNISTALPPPQMIRMLKPFIDTITRELVVPRTRRSAKPQSSINDQITRLSTR